jgi:uncharacterized membrane protein
MTERENLMTESDGGNPMDIETNRSTFVDGRDGVVGLPPIVEQVPAAPVVGEVGYAEPTMVQPVGFVDAPVVQAVVAPVARQVVVEHVAPVAQVQTVRSVRRSLFDPAPVCAGVVAVLLLVIGGITLARAGVDGSLDKPVVNVAGFTATALLGVFEVAFGVLLLIAALSRAREAIMFFSIIGVIAGLIGVFQPTVGNGSLALERGFAVLVTIAMLVVLISTVLPTVRRTASVVETI